MRLVARGMSNKAIARQLGISPRTVEGHLNHVFEKLDTTSRTELVHYALASSLFGERAAAEPPGTDPVSRAAVRRHGAVALERPYRTERQIGSSTESGPTSGSEVDTASATQPIGRPRYTVDELTFWILQLVILALSLIRLAATVAFHLDSTSLAVEFSTLGIFLVPVVYAALNFGLHGALFTAAGSPSSPFRVPRGGHSHNYVARGPSWPRSSCSTPWHFLVGQRVTAERDARRHRRGRPGGPPERRSPLPGSLRLKPGAHPHRRRQWLCGRGERLGSAGILHLEAETHRERRPRRQPPFAWWT